jgi:hypothetical protein
MEEENLPCHRMENGIEVALTEEEKTEIIAEWQSNEAEIAARLQAEEDVRIAAAERRARIDKMLASFEQG